jgi:hypothetical protein
MFIIYYIVPLLCLNTELKKMKFNNQIQKFLRNCILKILHEFHLKKDNCLNEINYFIDSLIL